MSAASSLFRPVREPAASGRRGAAGRWVAHSRGRRALAAFLTGLSIAVMANAEFRPVAGELNADAQAASIYSLDTLIAAPDPDEDLSTFAAGAGAPESEAITGVEIARGAASWYGDRFHGRRTASGERFDMYALTAAHPTLPFGTRIKVRRLDTGQEIEVRINDRGPHARGRILDLSRAAAQALGMLQAGESKVALVQR